VLREVVPVWSIGLTNGVWRNTVIEGWHSGTSPLTDGDMLRINSHTTYGVQKRLNGWLRTHELEVDGATSELDDVDLDDIEEMAALLHAWLTRPQRRPPTGMTPPQLAESVGGDIEEYAEDADEALSGLLAMAEESGRRSRSCAPRLTARWPVPTGGTIRAGLRMWTRSWPSCVIPRTSTSSGSVRARRR
jgi:hypothetical protein